MKKRIYLMHRNWRIAWFLLGLPLHLCIKAAWNGFRLKGNTATPWEGGGEADKKTNCSDCGNRNTPVCKYCEHDAEGGTDSADPAD